MMYSYPQSKIDDTNCYPLDKKGNADFITILSLYTLGGINFWKIPCKMSKQFVYTASFKLSY